MDVQQVKRKFKIKVGSKDTYLPDPDPTLSPEQVKDFYSNQYPEVLNSNISNQKVVDDELIIEFSSKFGQKG